MVIARRACPENLRHRIAPNPSGGFDLVTHYGYVLWHHDDRVIVADYYAGHCPQ